MMKNLVAASVALRIPLYIKMVKTESANSAENKNYKRPEVMSDAIYN